MKRLGHFARENILKPSGRAPSGRHPFRSLTGHPGRWRDERDGPDELAVTPRTFRQPSPVATFSPHLRRASGAR